MVNWLLWLWIVVFMLFVLALEPARADPQINLLNQGCSTYNVSRNFFNDLNASFSDLRKSLLDEKKHFATAQCRNYMSTNDCVKCFETAAVQIRSCGFASGARVIYDRCILRYESSTFYDSTTLPGNGQKCGNRTAQDAVTFDTAVGDLVKDLEIATPKTSDPYITTKIELTGGGGSVYGVAQCAETVTQTGCQEYLKVASANIQGCFLNTDARDIDAGCSLRYSTTPFFADTQTVNIRPFLPHGSSSKRKVIIGAVAGGVCLLLLALVLFYLYQLSRKAKASQIGIILEATQWQGLLLYSYKDLKNATKNFNEENKLGEAGFGEVFKGTRKNGNVVAVKKLMVTSSVAKTQFESEVKLISNVHHQNLIRLLGCSTKKAELLLVLEYMPNGRLDKFLYGELVKTMSRKMASWRRWPWMMIIVVLVLMLESARSDPQTSRWSIECSGYNPTNIQDFSKNRDTALAGLRSQLSNESKHFAKFEQPNVGDPVYAMVQCMNYLSVADCLKCYDTAVSELKSHCGTKNGARLIYDGCSLRYESSIFFGQAVLIEEAGQKCANQSASQTAEFTEKAQSLMKDLEFVTPKMRDFYAAVKKELAGGDDTIYAVAQCAQSISPQGCQTCLNVAYRNIQACVNNTDGRGFDVVCYLRYSNTRFFSDNQTTDITPFLRKGNSSKSSLIIGGVSGGIGFLLIVVALFLYFEYLKKLKARKGDILEATQLKGPLRYNYKDLKNATKHFHEENKLGEGGFGEVYKGILKNGDAVAVKKLTVSSHRAKAEFDSEVRLISNVHHKNLVRLLGFSSNEGELLLVYEYMRHGSLDRFVYGEERGTLNWRQRYDIIIGTARGLAYLHEQFHVCIIHRDMKSSNILIDEDFQPKIADFGLARLMPGGHSHLSTRFAGTLGYTAPEYAIYGHLSERVDTYSFGVVILEIISGRRSTDVKFEPVADFLLEEAWNLCQQDMHLKLVDDTLNPNEYTPEEVKKVIGVALACTQSPASARPSMSNVVSMLSADILVDQQLIGKPMFINADKTSVVDASVSTHSSFANATSTFAESSGRQTLASLFLNT